MSAPFPPPPAVDLLALATERVRPALMDQTKPTKARARILWAACKKSRGLGSSDVVHDEYMKLAVEANLIDQRGHWTDSDVRKSVRPFGAEDISHTITWALRGWNPFEKGSLK